MRRTDTLEKTLRLGKIEAGGDGDDRGWDGWMASLTWWTWVCASSGSWTGRPGVLQSMVSQRVRHNWATKLTDVHWISECNPATLSFAALFFCPQSFPASGSFPGSFSFSISPSYKYSGLISFRIDWFDPLAVQGTLKSLLQHHNSKESILRCSAFFMFQLSHPYMTTGKIIALTVFLAKAVSLLFNIILSRFLIAFLPRNNHLLISWLQSPSAVILVSKKSISASTFSTSFAMKWWDWMPWSFLVPSSRGSLVPLCFLPLECYHLHIWSWWYFSLQTWFYLITHPAWHFTWCALLLTYKLNKQLCCSYDKKIVNGINMSTDILFHILMMNTNNYLNF